MRVEIPVEVKRELVQRAAAIADKAKRSEKGDQSRQATTQLRNLVQITQVETDDLVLRNFLRYQAGRKTTKDLWGAILTDTVAVLERIAADKRLPEPAQRRDATQRFFGYLVREYVYVSGSDRRPAQGYPRSEARHEG
jgi:hypothetical protein